MRIRVPLAPAFLVASDAGLRPCPPPPLPSPWPLSSGSGSALGLVAVIGRSVGDPAPRARARARLLWLLPTGPYYFTHVTELEDDENEDGPGDDDPPEYISYDE